MNWASVRVMDRPEETTADSDASTNEPALLTRKMAAKRLSISTRTLDRMANAGFIERVFLGTVVRFRAEDVEAIVRGGA